MSGRCHGSTVRMVLWCHAMVVPGCHGSAMAVLWRWWGNLQLEQRGAEQPWEPTQQFKFD